MNASHPRGDSTRHMTAAATADAYVRYDAACDSNGGRQSRCRFRSDGPRPRVLGRGQSSQLPAGLAGRPHPAGRRSEPPPLNRCCEPPSASKLDAGGFGDCQTDAKTRTRIRGGKRGVLIWRIPRASCPAAGSSCRKHPSPTPGRSISARRLALMYKREYADNLRKGIKTMPKIRPIRPGDRIP